MLEYNKTYIMTCAQQRLSSACTSAQSGQFAWCSVGSQGPKASSCRQWRLRSDSVYVQLQANLSLSWVHMSLCRFCCAPALVNLIIYVPCHFVFLNIQETRVQREKNTQFYAGDMTAPSDVSSKKGLRWMETIQKKKSEKISRECSNQESGTKKRR